MKKIYFFHLVEKDSSVFIMENVIPKFVYSHCEVRTVFWCYFSLMGTSKTYKQEDNTKPHRLITERLVDDHRGGNKRSQKWLQTNKNKKSESGGKKGGVTQNQNKQPIQNQIWQKDDHKDYKE